jgi:hypothetical protein
VDREKEYDNSIDSSYGGDSIFAFMMDRMDVCRLCITPCAQCLEINLSQTEPHLFQL